MAKNSIRDYSATAGSNTDIQSVDIDENCAASGINNAIREIMADLKDVSTGAVNLETPVADTLGVNSAPASGVKLQVKTATDRHLAAFDNSAGPTLGAVTDAAASTTLRLAGSPLVMTGAGGSGAEHVRVSTSGNVGIGTTSPNAKAEISTSSGEVLRLTKATGAYLGFHDGTQTRAAFQGINGADGLTLHTGSSVTERMRITSDGYVGVGEASPTNMVQIDVGSRTTSGLVIENSSTNGYYGAAYRCHTNNGYAVLFQRGNSSVGSIFAGTSSTSYNTSSDHRLKENVADMTGAIDRVKALAPKRFNFIADADTTVDGFLAHEAQTVVPEAVTGTHNEVDDDGNAVMQGIDQAKLVPLLTGALKEAIAKIETLETKVAALEGN